MTYKLHDSQLVFRNLQASNMHSFRMIPILSQCVNVSPRTPRQAIQMRHAKDNAIMSSSLVMPVRPLQLRIQKVLKSTWRCFYGCTSDLLCGFRESSSLNRINGEVFYGFCPGNKSEVPSALKSVMIGVSTGTKPLHMSTLTHHHHFRAL